MGAYADLPSRGRLIADFGKYAAAGLDQSVSRFVRGMR